MKLPYDLAKINRLTYKKKSSNWRVFYMDMLWNRMNSIEGVEGVEGKNKPELFWSIWSEHLLQQFISNLWMGQWKNAVSIFF